MKNNLLVCDKINCTYSFKIYSEEIDPSEQYCGHCGTQSLIRSEVFEGLAKIKQHGINLRTKKIMENIEGK